MTIPNKAMAVPLAIAEVAAAEESRSAPYQFNTYGWPEYGIPGHAPEDARLLWELVRNQNTTTGIFLQNPTARTATLGLVRMRGQWRTADSVQSAIVGSGASLRRPLYDSMVYERTDPGAALRYTIDQGIVSLAGLTMLTRYRLLLETSLLQENMPDTIIATTKIVVSKLSTFVLNIAALEHQKDAVQELQLSIICSLIASCDAELLRRILVPDHAYISSKDDPPGRYSVQKQRADMATMAYAETKRRQYDISLGDVMRRMSEGNVNQLRRPESHSAIEHEIRNPSGLLIPATTTFYGERKLLKM